MTLNFDTVKISTSELYQKKNTIDLGEITMMQYIEKLLKKMKATEKGQGMVEYALIIAFVAAIAIFVLNGGLRTAVSSAFTKAASAVNSAADAQPAQ